MGCTASTSASESADAAEEADAATDHGAGEDAASAQGAGDASKSASESEDADTGDVQLQGNASDKSGAAAAAKGVDEGTVTPEAISLRRRPDERSREEDHPAIAAAVAAGAATAQRLGLRLDVPDHEKWRLHATFSSLTPIELLQLVPALVKAMGGKFTGDHVANQSNWQEVWGGKLDDEADRVVVFWVKAYKDRFTDALYWEVRQSAISVQY